MKGILRSRKLPSSTPTSVFTWS